MKRLVFSIIFFLAIIIPPSVFAQGMMGTQSGVSSDGHTAREEQEGKEVWEKLQDKQIACNKLSDEEFGALGEYFMGQMVGDSHEAMNTMMERMMGEEGEKQMHIVMGKRLSGCHSDAQLPQGGNPMMGGWNGFGTLGWLPMLLFWILLILGVTALFRYLGGSGKKSDENKSPLDILKERYARGDIDKKEFEEMKKDLR